MRAVMAELTADFKEPVAFLGVRWLDAKRKDGCVPLLGSTFVRPNRGTICRVLGSCSR